LRRIAVAQQHTSFPLAMTTIQASVPLRYALLTVVAALATLSMKFYAAWLTDSVGLLSDALESIVNLVTSVLLVILIRIAKAPPDVDHPHGHDKAEYFANGVQGTLIMLAGVGITAAAAQRFLHPKVLEAGGLGLAVSLVAGLVNGVTAQLLARAGKVARSKALEGEAAHLMTDVWTSVAVLAGVALVYVFHWAVLDPLIAMVMSGFILWTGWKLVMQSVAGLMDASLPSEGQARVEAVLDGYCSDQGITYHALRSRIAGARIFVSVHILVPGSWTVLQGHELMDEIESKISQALGGASVLTHLEPIEEEISFQDIDL
jgi:cation diffusion facilitator family transporter